MSPPRVAECILGGDVEMLVDFGPVVHGIDGADDVLHGASGNRHRHSFDDALAQWKHSRSRHVHGIRDKTDKFVIIALRAVGKHVEIEARAAVRDVDGDVEGAHVNLDQVLMRRQRLARECLLQMQQLRSENE